MARSHPEFMLTVQIADFLKLAVPADWPWSHFPAGERRDQRTGAKLKAMGLKPGWPDFIFILPEGRVGFIEVKAAGGALSPEQRAFRDRATAAGARWAMARSVNDVVDALEGWGLTLTGRLAA